MVENVKSRERFGQDFRIDPMSSIVTRTIVSLGLVLAVIGTVFIHMRSVEMRRQELANIEAWSTHVGQAFAEAAVGLPNEPAALKRAMELFAYGPFCGAEILSLEEKTLINNGYPDRLTVRQISRDVFMPDENHRATAKFRMCVDTGEMEQKIAGTRSRETFFFVSLLLATLISAYIAMQFLVGPLNTIGRRMGHVAANMRPIRDPRLLSRNEIGLLAHGFNSMVADLVESRHLLETARRDAEKSELAKTEFLANMSHELRTPLNNILGTAQLLHDRPLGPGDRELLTIMEKSSVSLLNIVNEILDLSKIEAGEVHLERIPFDAYEKIRDTAQSFQAQAGRKGIAFSEDTAGASLFVMGDPFRFERVLANLAGNALRYTDKGGIRIKTSFHPRGATGGLLRCDVSDTGIGIPKDRQDRIFERFTQADNSTSRRFGGTGLGLTITRELVLLMRGRIGVDSEPSKGSTFWFEIPVDTTAKPEAPAPICGETGNTGAYAPGAVRVLIAEDHEINQVFMRRLLEKLGIAHYMFADTGTKVVELVQTAAFDLVLMDCHMPEMDGYTATAVIRGLDDPSLSRIPIVAMTANAMPRDEQRCLAAGMDGYIAKPFEITTFKRVLSRWIRFQAAPEAQRPTPTTPHATPANLDILRDSAEGDQGYIREVVALFLKTANARLEELRASGDSGPQCWVEAAHGLKGTAGVVGAARLRQLAEEAEVLDHTDPSARQAALAGLETEIRALSTYFVNEGLAS